MTPKQDPFEVHIAAAEQMANEFLRRALSPCVRSSALVSASHGELGVVWAMRLGFTLELIGDALAGVVLALQVVSDADARGEACPRELDGSRYDRLVATTWAQDGALPDGIESVGVTALGVCTFLLGRAAALPDAECEDPSPTGRLRAVLTEFEVQVKAN